MHHLSRNMTAVDHAEEVVAAAAEEEIEVATMAVEEEMIDLIAPKDTTIHATQAETARPSMNP